MSYKVITLLHVNRSIGLTAKILWNVKDGNRSFYVLANHLCEMGRAVTPKVPCFLFLGTGVGSLLKTNTGYFAQALPISVQLT